jgi:hypothetical protein
MLREKKYIFPEEPIQLEKSHQEEAYSSKVSSSLNSPIVRYKSWISWYKTDI